MFYYVYILESLSHPDDYYTGITTNLRKRLDTHNSGGNAHTRHARLWIIKTAIAFTDKKQACLFERFVKSAQVAPTDRHKRLPSSRPGFPAVADILVSLAVQCYSGTDSFYYNVPAIYGLPPYGYCA